MLLKKRNIPFMKMHVQLQRLLFQFIPKNVLFGEE